MLSPCLADNLQPEGDIARMSGGLEPLYFFFLP